MLCAANINIYLVYWLLRVKSNTVLCKVIGQVFLSFLTALLLLSLVPEEPELACISGKCRKWRKRIYDTYDLEST